MSVTRVDVQELRRLNVIWAARVGDLIDRVEDLETVIRSMDAQCRLGIRRAAFAPDIGQRMTEEWRLDMAAECAKLEALARLDGTGARSRD